MKPLILSIILLASNSFVSTAKGSLETMEFRIKHTINHTLEFFNKDDFKNPIFLITITDIQKKDVERIKNWGSVVAQELKEFGGINKDDDWTEFDPLLRSHISSLQIFDPGTVSIRFPKGADPHKQFILYERGVSGD